MLEEYYSRIGGRPIKSGRPQKRRVGPAASTVSPASLKDFKPPTGNWEEEITVINEANQKEDGSIYVVITWKNGCMTEHPVDRAYERCPQKVSLV
jgi:chromobox protein 1